MIGRAFKTSVLILTTLLATGCSRYSNIIVYDEQWSSNIGVAAVQCAASVQDTCRKDSIQDEIAFAQKLKADFLSEPECKGLDFVVDSDRTKPIISPYWRLRVEYRPHLIHQEATVSHGDGKTIFGIEADTDTVEHSAAFIIRSTCKTSKENGVVAIW
jgi:hypothetical protein